MDGILPRHVKHLTTTRTLSRASADAWAAPRDDLMVLEERQDDGTLAALDGPWRHWSRRVTIEPVGPGDDDETVRLT